MSKRSMRGHVNKYLDLAKNVSSTKASNQSAISVRLELSPGGHTTLLDFSFLNDRPQMQHVVLQYFMVIGESLAPITKDLMRRSLRDFVHFLDEYESKNAKTFRTTEDLDPSIMLNFRMWLELRSCKTQVKAGGAENRKLDPKSVASFYNQVVLLINRLRRYNSEWFPKLTVNLPRARRRPALLNSVPDVLSMKDLKKILKVTKAEIDCVRRRYEEVQAILQKTKNLAVVPFEKRRPDGYWHHKENLVHSLLREQPIGAAIHRNIKTAANRFGTSVGEILGAYIPLGEASLLPFVLQLLVQTGLNVSSLAALTRDCIQEFTLPQYKKLMYDKARSRSRRAKSQLIPNSSRGEDGPVELIQFLLKWTEPLLEGVPHKIKNNLFIFRGFQGQVDNSKIGVLPKYEPFQHTLKTFRRNHPELPKFALNDLRPAVATYLYLTTHDVFRVKRFLGHSSIKTTMVYIRGRILSAELDFEMAVGIKQMIDRLTHNPISDKHGKRSLPILAAVVENTPNVEVEKSKVRLLGDADSAEIERSGVLTLVARCMRPDKPPEYLKVPAGQLCTSIFKCLNCTNAIVLEDDLPTLLLRLKHIWMERERLTREGWQVVYGEAWMALNQAVRLFSNGARERAERKIAFQLESQSAML